MSTNPFLGFGRTVLGDRLVGREEVLSEVLDRLSIAAGSVSIVGEHRIGKTSLISEVLRRLRLGSARLAISFINVSTISTSAMLFGKILSELLKSAEDSMPSASLLLSDMKNGLPQDAYESFEQCDRGLRLMSDSGVRSLLILDEFDSVRLLDVPERTIFRLRDLADHQEETGLAIVFISRRTLYSIEKKLSGISNLDGVCEKFFVRPLYREGLRLMVDRCGDHWRLSQGEFDLLYSYTGGHPYLSEMLLCKSWAHRSIGAGLEVAVGDLFDHYEHLRQLLEEDHLFGQILQCAVGPRWSLTAEAIERLRRYGLIVSSRDPNGGAGHFSGWSDHFQNYLEKCSREASAWEVWRSTENSLRGFIGSELYDFLGADWKDELARRNGKFNIKKIIDECEGRMERERRGFGWNASERWLDYAYPMDLWMILNAEWGRFSGIMGKDRRYWAERFELLSKVRTPYAHSREYIVPEHEVLLAQAYCKEILQVVQGPRSSGS